MIKLFLDQERTAAGDEALARAMKDIPVVLQSRLEPTSGTVVIFRARFAFSRAPLSTSVSGDRGWIPIPRFMEAAADVGFVDFAGDEVPLLETYRGRHYKSIVVCMLELQSGLKARLDDQERLAIGEWVFPTNRHYVQTVKRTSRALPGFSLSAFLSGGVDETLVRGRVVVLGFTGRGAPKLSTPAGEMEAHVFFGQCLRAVFETIDSADR